MLEFSLWGIGGAVLTGILLEALKRVWLDADGQQIIKDRWAVLAAVVIGIVCSVAAYLGSIYPSVATWVDVLGGGVLAGLTACGLYSALKRR